MFGILETAMLIFAGDVFYHCDLTLKSFGSSKKEVCEIINKILNEEASVCPDVLHVTLPLHKTINDFIFILELIFCFGLVLFFYGGKTYLKHQDACNHSIAFN